MARLRREGRAPLCVEDVREVCAEHSAIGRVDARKSRGGKAHALAGRRSRLAWVLVLGAYAALRVRGGALRSNTGRTTIARRSSYRRQPKPHTILFDSHGEFMTGEAIRWCARYSINLLLPGGPGRIITMVESALETKTNTMTRMRDIDPVIIRAQCAADPVKMAREIVRAKIEAGLRLTMTDADARRRAAKEWEAKLNRRAASPRS